MDVSKVTLSHIIDAPTRLGPYYENAIATLQSLNVVEYIGPKTAETCYSSNNVRIEVQVYDLFQSPRSFEESQEIPQAEITPMPHVRFERVWNE